MITEKYVVTYCDSGDSCDGRPRFGGMFNSYDEAKKWVEEDIEGYEKNGFSVDYDDMSADTCIWNIQKISIEV